MAQWLFKYTMDECMIEKLTSNAIFLLTLKHQLMEIQTLHTVPYLTFPNRWIFLDVTVKLAHAV